MDASRRPRVRPIVCHSARILGSAIGRCRVVVGNSRIMQSREGWEGENVCTCTYMRMQACGGVERWDGQWTETKARFSKSLGDL